MLVACEIPIKYLPELYSLTDYPFIINIYRDIPEYVEFYKKACQESDHSILDTGIFEVSSGVAEGDISIEAIREGIKLFKPKYVVAPEILGDGEATIKAIKEFKEKIKDLDVSICGVVQGSDLGFAEDCFNELQDLVDLIAIPFVFPYSDKIIEDNPAIESIKDKTIKRSLVRIEIVNTLLRSGPKKPVHLLGMNCPLEIKALSHHDCIISTDSSSAVQHGLAEIKYTPEGIIPGGKIVQEHGYIKKEGMIHLSQFDCIKFNIDFLKES